MVVFLTQSTNHLRHLLLIRQAYIGIANWQIKPTGGVSLRLGEDVAGLPSSILGSVTEDPSSLIELLATQKMLRDGKTPQPTIIIPSFAYGISEEGQVPIDELFMELIRDTNPYKIIIFDAPNIEALKHFGATVAEVSSLPLIANELRQYPKTLDRILALNKRTFRWAKYLHKLLGLSNEPLIIEKGNFGAKIHGQSVAIICDVLKDNEETQEAIWAVSRASVEDIHLVAPHTPQAEQTLPALLSLPIVDIWTTNTHPQERRERVHIADITPRILELLNP